MASARSEGSESSVGAKLAGRGVLGAGSQYYTAYTERLANALRELHLKEMERRKEATTVLVPFTPGTVRQAELTAAYPEFDVIWAPRRNPVHAAFEAERLLALNWCRKYGESYSGRQLIVGDGLLSCVVSGDADAHLEVDESDPVAMNLNHQGMVDVMRFYAAGDALQASYGVSIQPSLYNAYLQGTSLGRCTKGRDCEHKADVYIADLSLYAMTQEQFLRGMVQANSTLGMAFLPYNPVMFADSVGELPGAGVGYEVDGREVRFVYADGVAGATSYPAESWHQWLTGAYRRLTVDGVAYAFQFEIRQARGNFLFVTAVRVNPEYGDPHNVTHALEMPWAEGQVVATYHRLRDFSVDPRERSSWELVTRYFPKRVAENLYLQGMVLEQSAFSWENLLKRAYIGDNRVTISGTGVVHTPPMSAERAHELVSLVYARCFVDRYETGRLHAEAMAVVKKVAWFGTATRGARFGAILAAITMRAYKATVGGLMSQLASGLVALGRWFETKPDLTAVWFRPAATFILFEDYARGWLTKWHDELFSRQSLPFVVSGLRGVGGGYTAPKGERAWRALRPPGMCTRMRSGQIVEDLVDTREPGVVTSGGAEALAVAKELNEVGRSTFSRFDLRMATARPEAEPELGRENFETISDYVAVINEVHEAVFPGMAEQEFGQDATSLAVDPQHREMDARFMRFPVTTDRLPPDREVFKSRLHTYRVERRPQTLSETLSALTARNLAAPNISMVQNQGKMISLVWENFLDTACVGDARERIAEWASDRLILEDEAFLEWSKKARPGVLKTMKDEMVRVGKAFEEYEVGQYLLMLKSDAKPPLSDKPISEQVAPQVIVYHEKVLSAFYSSIFRVVARRLLSLLRPEWMANLLKDTRDVARHVAAHHPWGEAGLKFLENDFSKYDKSQNEFVFKLEAYVYEQLGFNQELLDRWLQGHENCQIRSLSLGLVLHVEWQRKSGDATTALGNVLVNMLSVCYAYRGCEVAWAVFMGDDSVVCCRAVVATRDSLDCLGQVFNLSAKFVVSRNIYFASHFFLPDDVTRTVLAVPDGIKRAQRFAVSVNAIDPKWEEKYTSNRDACVAYLHADRLAGLADGHRERYGVPAEVDLDSFFAAIATAVSTPELMRGLWEEKSTVIR